MLRPGAALLHPKGRQRLILRRTATQTDGRVLEFEVFYRGGDEQCREHAHTDQEHQVEVLAGSVLASLSGRVHALQPGDVLLIPTGEPHVVWNPFRRSAHAVWHVFPARACEAYLEAEWVAEGVRGPRATFSNA